MVKEKNPQKEQIKVTDKRIFTPDGEIREEFRKDIKPVEPSFTPAPPPVQEKAPPRPNQEERRARAEGPPPGGERRRTLADKAQNPGTAFADFVGVTFVEWTRRIPAVEKREFIADVLDRYQRLGDGSAADAAVFHFYQMRIALRRV